ncbi:hypothetical protein JOF35_001096 [Streptomyces demainii]|uniref:Uncharacterized protein n=1 Tax=Streptomyces demainii TaxID=588122 RepID=A0ABT9KK64_9ACTN|nr:hypothetical protein [Streptomyces demainii]
MNLLEIIRHILVPALLGALAVWVGITRIPWTPPRDEDQ